MCSMAFRVAQVGRYPDLVATVMKAVSRVDFVNLDSKNTVEIEWHMC